MLFSQPIKLLQYFIVRSLDLSSQSGLWHEYVKEAHYVILAYKIESFARLRWIALVSMTRGFAAWPQVERHLRFHKSQRVFNNCLICSQVLLTIRLKRRQTYPINGVEVVPVIASLTIAFSPSNAVALSNVISYTSST